MAAARKKGKADPDDGLAGLRREFRAELPARADALDAALLLLGPAPAEGRAAVRRLAHMMRGAAGSYGFPELSVAAAEVEDGPDAELEVRARALVAALRTAGGRAVLLVEDDPLISRLLVAELGAAGPEVTVAPTAAAAAGLLAGRRFGVIVMDLHLPDGDGRRLLAEWRARADLRDVPIFVLSADLGPATKAECFAAGADAFFDKPLRAEVVAAAVLARLARSGLARPGEPAPAAPPAARRVLVVEDDPLITAMVRHRLDRAGFAVELAGDGEAALAAARRQPPDLVVLDLNLPLMNGFQVLERLRADPGSRAVPVLILTASGGEKDLVRAFGLGADDYLVKPFSPSELLARVQRLRLKVAGPVAGPP
jgi:DNA-binding response OmpR family regulator